MGWLIAISGLDGAGKSTLIDTLTEKLESNGKSIHFIRVRLGFTPLLERIKISAGVNETKPSGGAAATPKKKPSLLKRSVQHIYRLWSIFDLAWLFLWISLLRAAGKKIITDRYYWDNRIIYQEKYGEPGWFARALWGLARWTARQPDAAFMLLIPGEESYRRVISRNHGAVEESPEVLERRARLYAELEQPGLVIIDALQPQEQVFGLVWEQLPTRIKI